ncbi:hypothetical protein IX51_07905 [uncultured archaeon]|nr:hypothetical protein IX51_07905 [uncultured archaeon]HKJ96708.1 nitroreductase family protein [Thermoplasmataceae archaeon]
MQFDELLDRRRSTRAFSRDSISEDQVRSILEAANKAPSAGNLQAYGIFAVSDHDKLTDLVAAAKGQEFIAEAPICFVFCADPERSESEYGKRGRDLYSIQDATIAATFAILKAVDLGLASVWVGSFDEERVSNIIGAYKLRPVAIIPVGHGAENPEAKPRRKLSSLVHEM